MEPGELIGVRFNMRDWYAVFRAECVSGEEGRALLGALGVEAVHPTELVLKPEILDRERWAHGKAPLTKLT